ncbi:MAG: hypothetical protein AAGG07_07480 [Planctomycetota bacterium]
MDIRIALTAMVAAAGVASAQNYNEMGDAAEYPGAQLTGSGALDTISGSIDAPSGDHVDAYRIRISDAANFYATTSTSRDSRGNTDDGAGDTWDSRLWLFDLSGNLVMGNDDDPLAVSTFGGGDGTFQSTIAQPSWWDANVGGAQVNAPGSVSNGSDYILVISYFPNDADDAAGTDLAAFTSDFDGLHGLNPAAGAFAGWENTGTESGSYVIALNGASAVPAPAAAALLGLGGLAAGRRRR